MRHDEIWRQREGMPLTLGIKVRVVSDHPHAGEWPDVYMITGLEFSGNDSVNISIGEDEGDRYGGWSVFDLRCAQC